MQMQSEQFQNLAMQQEEVSAYQRNSQAPKQVHPDAEQGLELLEEADTTSKHHEATGTSKRVGIILAITVGTVCLFGAYLTWLRWQPNPPSCISSTSSVVLKDPNQVLEVQAVKVVVEPWKGKHRVYGIFMVPDAYKNSRKYLLTMTVGNWYKFNPVDRTSHLQSFEGVQAKPGHYLVRNFLPTRVALWFWMTGQFTNLEQSCNWSLQVIKQTENTLR